MGCRPPDDRQGNRRTRLFEAPPHCSRFGVECTLGTTLSPDRGGCISPFLTCCIVGSRAPSDSFLSFGDSPEPHPTHSTYPSLHTNPRGEPTNRFHIQVPETAPFLDTTNDRNHATSYHANYNSSVQESNNNFISGEWCVR